MSQYKSSNYYALISQGKLIEALEYLKLYPNKSKTIKKYFSLFQEDNIRYKSKSSEINNIVSIYHEYYKKIFWEGINKKDAFNYLCTQFSKTFDFSLPEEIGHEELVDFWDDHIEDRIERLVEDEGYNYLGGKTQGFYGPYIWKKNVLKTYKVKLPDGYTNYSVYMAKGFVSKSWMSYISFDKIGTGGWTGKDGSIYCVWKSYRRQILLPKFQIHFLKHEAQHSVDLIKNKEMSSVDLEYRAKLVELIYSKKIKCFNRFLLQADGEDETNSHSYASYLIISRLSERIFKEDYVSDSNKWKKYLREIRSVSLELFNEYPDGV